METAAYRLLLTEIYNRPSTEKTFSKERLCKSFENSQQFLASQDPAELPTALQLAITASPSFPSTNFYCDFSDFELYGGWTSFFVQSEVMKVFTSHNCQTCRTGSLQGCLVCLTWVAFSGYDLIIDAQNVTMNSSRYNGFSSAVEGVAGPDGVKLNFLIETQEPIGCSVKT
jgi:hypothetical protein